MQAASTGAMTRRARRWRSSRARRRGLLDLGVRREIFKGQHVVRGQRRTARRVDGSGELAGGEDGGVQRLGGLVVGDDDDARGVGGADEEREIEGAGGAVSPETRLRPVPPLRWRRTRSKASECSRSARSSRTKGRTMLVSQIPIPPQVRHQQGLAILAALNAILHLRELMWTRRR
jgi:hypothetical protein